MRHSLADHVCLVTGGAQGIGWAISQALVRQRARVFACDIATDQLERAERERATWSQPNSITLARCDVTDRRQFEAWIADAHRQAGRIDVLVNNAAFIRWTNVLDMTVEEAERTMRVGYDAMVYGVKAVLPMMLAAGHGHIVNIGSSAGRIFAGASSAAYAAMKAAVDGYTQTLQVELADTPIHVMLVRPAAMGGTGFFRQHVPSSRLPRLMDFIPYLTPPQLAGRVARGLNDRRAILDAPGYLHFFYGLFFLSPRLFRWLMRVGGPGRRDYGRVEWR